VSRVFYRVIQGPVPTLKDFIPLKELGRLLKNSRLKREWESSVSVYDDLEYTMSRTREFPKMGSYIAKLVIPDDGSIEFAKTMDDEHHYSIYAPPEQLLPLVVGAPIPKE
jgi:hypothetical protein